MDYDKRQAVIVKGRVPFEFNEWFHFAVMTFCLGALFVCLCLCIGGIATETVAFVVLLVLFVFFLWAILSQWNSGKLEIISETVVPMETVRILVERLGYEAVSYDEFHLDLRRNFGFQASTTDSCIFIHETKLVGFSVTRLPSDRRLPFVTGKSQTQEIRQAIWNSQLHEKPSLPTQKTKRPKQPTRLRRKWGK